MCYRALPEQCENAKRAYKRNVITDEHGYSVSRNCLGVEPVNFLTTFEK